VFLLAEEAIMEIRVITGDISQHQADAIIVNLFEGVSRPGGATGAVDKALNGALSSLIAKGEYKGRLHEMAIVDTFGRLQARRVIVAGLGPASAFDLDRARDLSENALKFARENGLKTVATIVHGAGIGGLSPKEAAQALTEGALRDLHRFRHDKSTGQQGEGELEELRIVEFDASKVTGLEEGVRISRTLAESGNWPSMS
jgi:leucyl aminopeptidase